MQKLAASQKSLEDGHSIRNRLFLAPSAARFTAYFQTPLYDLNYVVDNRSEVSNTYRVNPCACFYADFWFTNLSALITANGQGLTVTYTYEIGDIAEQLNIISGQTTGFLNDMQNHLGVSNTLPASLAITNNLSRIKITGERYFRFSARFFFAVNTVIPFYTFRLGRGETSQLSRNIKN